MTKEKELTEEELEEKYSKPPFPDVMFKLTKKSVQLQITPITDEVVLLSESGGFSQIVLLKDCSQAFKIQGANVDEILKRFKRFKKTESIVKALKKTYPLIKSHLTE